LLLLDSTSLPRALILEPPRLDSATPVEELDTSLPPALLSSRTEEDLEDSEDLLEELDWEDLSAT